MENKNVCPGCQKKTMRTEEERRKLVNRLKRVEGQIRGIIGMLENDAYYDGVRYMQGSLPEEEVLAKGDAVSSFAVAMERLFRGDRDGAAALLERIILASPQGFWPAETELLRLRAGDAD